ncbi:MAG: glycosyltransferase [Chloroflexi bacterium]|nr:glycosyltransferase [Chloroflexota bacterium]
MDVQNIVPRVSIVIPVRNAERTLDTTMEYVAALDYPKDRMQVILADGGSTDGTVQLIRHWQHRLEYLTLVEVPNCTSPGHARNEALKEATGEYVLFTDGDCAPNEDWVREILEPFLMDEGIGGVGGEVLTLRTDPNNETEAYCEQVGFLSVAGRCGITENGYFPALTDRAPHEVNGGNDSPFFATANAAFRKSVIDEIGGGFWAAPTGEDVDFSLRIVEKGHKLYFAKTAVVKHMHRVSLESYLKQWYGYGYGHPLLIAKHAADKLEFVFQLGNPVFVKVPSPLKGIVHVGAFHLMHLLLATSIASGVLSALSILPALVPLASVSLLAGAAAAYFAPCLRLRPADKFATWCKIRYLTNLACVKGAIAGCRKFGAICIEPSW